MHLYLARSKVRFSRSCAWLGAACFASVLSLAHAEEGAWHSLQPVSSARLDNLRGGFDFGAGMQISFGISREILINGEVVATTRLVLSNLDNLFRGRAPTIELSGQALTLIQNGWGNVALAPASAAAAAPASIQAASTSTSLAPVSTTALSAAPSASASPTTLATNASLAPVIAPGPASVASSAAPIAPAIATAAPIAVAQTPSASSSSASVASNNPVTNIQVGAPIVVNGSSIPLSLGEAIALGVQNTVSNQLIQARTVIDATVVSMNALRAQLNSTAFRDSLLSGRAR